MDKEEQEKHDREIIREHNRRAQKEMDDLNSRSMRLGAFILVIIIVLLAIFGRYCCVNPMPYKNESQGQTERP